MQPPAWFLSPKDWGEAPPHARHEWEHLAELARQYLQDVGAPYLQRQIPRDIRPAAGDTNDSLTTSEQYPFSPESVSKLVADLLAAVEAAVRGDVSDPAVSNIVSAYTTFGGRRETLQNQALISDLARIRLIRVLVKQLSLVDVVYALYAVWYIKADANQEGSRNWRLAQRPTLPLTWDPM